MLRRRGCIASAQQSAAIDPTPPRGGRARGRASRSHARTRAVWYSSRHVRSRLRRHRHRARRCSLIVGGVKIVREYERAVVLRLGRLVGRARAGRDLHHSVRRADVQDRPAHDHARRAVAGRDHARQRLGEGQRGALLPRHRSRRGPSSRCRTTSTPPRSWRRRRCAASAARRSSTSCSPSASGSTRSCRRSSTPAPSRGASR